MRLKHFLVLIYALFCPIFLYGQIKDAFNGTRQSVGGGNSSAFSQNRANNFNDYRQKLNAEYVSKTREKWKDFNSFRGLTLPDKDAKPVSPINMSDEDARRDRQDNQINIDGVMNPIRNNGNPPPSAPGNHDLYMHSYGAWFYEQFPRRTMVPHKDIMFEGHLFEGPADPEEHCRIIYGDYMQLPPREQRDRHKIDIEIR